MGAIILAAAPADRSDRAAVERLYCSDRSDITHRVDFKSPYDAAVAVAAAAAAAVVVVVIQLRILATYIIYVASIIRTCKYVSRLPSLLMTCTRVNVIAYGRFLVAQCRLSQRHDSTCNTLFYSELHVWNI